MKTAESHPGDYWWFYNQVRNSGPWDYKQQGRAYQAYGNFNFGLTAAAAGIPLTIALRMAGWAQQQAGTSKPEWGNPWAGRPFGDDPKDQTLIRQGYYSYGTTITSP